MRLGCAVLTRACTSTVQPQASEALPGTTAARRRECSLLGTTTTTRYLSELSDRRDPYPLSHSPPLSSLQRRAGFLNVGMDTSAEELRERFNMSRTQFRRALGYLRRYRYINELTSGGVWCVHAAVPTAPVRWSLARATASLLT